MLREKLVSRTCFVLVALITLSTSISCGPSSQNPDYISENEDSLAGPIENYPDLPPIPTDEWPQSVPAPAWENSRPEARDWSLFVAKFVRESTPQLLEGSADITELCPDYNRLDERNRAAFWAHFISAVAYYESGWRTTTRFHESSMGIDPITDQPVYSEGLLQLSYQDVRAYPFCNEFNWSSDRRLAPTDPRKTIFHPLKNLRCGLLIMNRQLERRNRILLESGVYWAVLKIGGRFNKIPQIQSTTRKLPICKKAS
jgi:hypothetical protein